MKKKAPFVFFLLLCCALPAYADGIATPSSSQSLSGFLVLALLAIGAAAAVFALIRFFHTR